MPAATPPGADPERADSRVPSHAQERVFDALTRIAGYLCDAPMAAIVLDEAGGRRVASVHGLSAERAAVLAFCGARPEGVDEVHDTLLDERLRVQALVSRPPGIRSCASVTLANSAGRRIGMLMLMDRQPRRFTPTMKLAVRQLGIIAARLIEVQQREQAAPRDAGGKGIDPLTGLADLQSFERHAQALLGAGGQQPHALLFIDLDQFRRVDEEAGKAAGDELLRQAAKVFLSIVRQGDVLAYLGGDKFGALLENCPPAQARRVAHQLVDAMRGFRFERGGETFAVSASVGVVEIGEQRQDVATLIEDGHAACRIAKHQGRNRVHVAAKPGTDVDAEIDWVALITSGVQEDRFYLSYQRILPVFAPEPGEPDLDFFEVLLRFSHENGRSVPTGELIARAQRYGLTPMMDHWVVRTLFAALGNHARNPGAGDIAPRRFSVNVSAASISDPSFLDFVIEQFRASGAPPDSICFDIQETVALANLDRARQFVLVLKELGCRFSLDDFGSGLTSFNYLKTLPVDFLKIDGGYVKTVTEDSLSEAMIKAINDIGHLLGMKTIAESVENDEILERLRMIGVDYIQGYGVHMPVPFDGPNAQPALPRRPPVTEAPAQ